MKNLKTFLLIFGFIFSSVQCGFIPNIVSTDGDASKNPVQPLPNLQGELCHTDQECSKKNEICVIPPADDFFKPPKTFQGVCQNAPKPGSICNLKESRFPISEVKKRFPTRAQNLVKSEVACIKSEIFPSTPEAPLGRVVIFCAMHQQCTFLNDMYKDSIPPGYQYSCTPIYIKTNSFGKDIGKCELVTQAGTFIPCVTDPSICHPLGLTCCDFRHAQVEFTHVCYDTSAGGGKCPNYIYNQHEDKYFNVNNGYGYCVENSDCTMMSQSLVCGPSRICDKK